MSETSTAMLDIDAIHVKEGGKRRSAFLARLERMTPEERLAASRFSFETRERTVWAAHYPHEVPLINGEFEWIALRSADAE